MEIHTKKICNQITIGLLEQPIEWPK